MANKINSHFTPVLANKHWHAESRYISYTRNPYTGMVERGEPGKKQWGRIKGLYPVEIERALNEELESSASSVYMKLIQFEAINESERRIWSQFLLSQLVRTPSFLKYENWAKNYYGIKAEPSNPLVGCQECDDLELLLDRPWLFLIAHEDDHFIRTDNPIIQTGFIERERSCLFYPLTPRICFLACSVEDGWWNENRAGFSVEMGGYELEKGGTWMINFYLARASQSTLIASPNSNESLGNTMFSEILGLYPQPPFSLHQYKSNQESQAYESVRNIQSQCDGCIFRLTVTGHFNST